MQNVYQKNPRPFKIHQTETQERQGNNAIHVALNNILVSPPPKIATFRTDAATNELRAKLSCAVDHFLVTMLNKSTAVDLSPFVRPPENKATFPMDAAAREPLAMLRRAVDHVPNELSYKSTS
jgi:hypothetical protein